MAKPGEPHQLPSGAWQARYRDADGRRHTRSFPTKGAARNWKADREADVRRGDHHDTTAGRITFGVFAEQWMAARGVEITTAAANRSRLDKHLIPTFGSVPIGRITRLKVQAWVRTLERAGLAANSVHACAYLMSGVMREAVREGLVRVNPAADLDLPVQPPGRDRTFTRDEVERLYTAAVDPYDTLILLMAYTGLRMGEAVGLRVRGLDLLGRRLIVRDTLIEVGGKITPKAYPKGRSWRTVPLTGRLVDALAAHLAAHPAGRDDLVFRGARGAPISRSRFRARQWIAALEKAGIDYAPPHTLRHTYGSWLVEAGRPLTEVQKLLGHGSVTTTARYLHVVTEDFGGTLGALEGVQQVATAPRNMYPAPHVVARTMGSNG